MKTNLRYFYSIFFCTVGFVAIKHFYFYMTNKNELDFNLVDNIAIGGASGIILTQILLTHNIRNTIYGGVFGIFYGIFFNQCVNLFVNRRKHKAEKMGINF